MPNKTHEIAIDLTPGNLKKIKNSDSFQVSAESLQGGNYYFSLSNAVYKKFERAYTNNVGMRFTDYRYLEFGEHDMNDIEGGNLKSFGQALGQKSKIITRKISKTAKKAGNRTVNILLDKGEKMANRQLNKIEKAVENELDHLQKFTDDKTDKVINGVESKINKKISAIGSQIQTQSDATQRKINAQIEKTFGEEIDQVLDDELEGGRVRWKRLGKRLKNAGKKVINNVSKDVSRDIKKTVVKKANQFANSNAGKAIANEVKNQTKDMKQKTKRYIANKAIDVGSQIIGSAANYVVPGSGEIVETGAKMAIKRGVKEINGSGIKGSQAMKDKMARLRGMRKSVSGSGFMPSGSGFHPSGSGFYPSGSGFRVT